MQRVCLSLLLCLGFSFSMAQTDHYIVSRQGTITLMPLYQNWSIKDGGHFSEFGTGLAVYLPVTRVMNFSLRAGQFNAGGDVSRLSGLTDIMAGFSYHWEPANIVFSCGLNVPSGKTNLTLDQFATSVLFSATIFNMQYPNFGQGVGINPGLTWVFPANDNLVLGLGASYQYKGKYVPREGMDQYTPGGELIITGGADVRLTEAQTLSGDFLFTHYGTDKIGSEKVFASGNAYSGNIQYRQFMRENELWILLRYRGKAKGEIATSGGLVPEPERIEPSRFEIQTQYKWSLNTRVSLRFLAEGRFYESTPATYSGASVFGFGILPALSLPSGLTFPARLKYQIGLQSGKSKFTGIEAGIGVGFSF